ncbi:hypothetical protein NEOCIP111885_03145 [Pseudoneobacillus rhizosphaerae]|uniref:Uncharacterized protein n=1 Tax=Pseudoneobacillus rhizosphaerae TaxID=2880968 RepID=A0A9C7GBQ8_9BACI|nr:hypothetical protein NEOCIP111885_03145 [Pseudoneobacillus rhizosphaerae]
MKIPAFHLLIVPLPRNFILSYFILNLNNGQFAEKMVNKFHSNIIPKLNLSSLLRFL